MEPDAILFRKLCTSDVGRIAELERSCNSMPWNAVDLGLFAADSHASGSQRLALVAELEASGEISAYVCASLMDDEGEILVFGVDPKRRHRGIGRALLMESGKALKASGCRNVFLEVRHGNEAAISLYRSTGFVETGIRKGYYADTGEDARMMRWDLATLS